MTTTNTTCSRCGGALIGTEQGPGSCGHCGGRHLNPSRRRTIATVTTRTQPTTDDLDALIGAYIEEGYRNVAAIPMPANTTHAPAGWEVKVIAEGNPYQATA